MTTDPISYIDACYANLNDTNQRIADWLRENASDASHLPIDYVAENLCVSKSTLVRFSQKLGYSGWAAFKQDLARIVYSRSEGRGDLVSGRAAVLIATEYASYIKAIPELLDEATLEGFAERIVRADRVLIAGYDRSFHSAEQLRKRLLNLGICSQATADLRAFEGVFGQYGGNNLILAFSVSDHAHTFTNLAKELREAKANFACITCTPALPFKGQCAGYITLPRPSRDPELSLLDDQVIFFVFIEILIDAVAKHVGARE